MSWQDFYKANRFNINYNEVSQDILLMRQNKSYANN